MFQPFYPEQWRKTQGADLSLVNILALNKLTKSLIEDINSCRLTGNKYNKTLF